MTALHPVGPELGVKNRRLTAERLHWPAGVLEVCEQLEAESPEWSVSWSGGGWMTWTKPGLYAQRRGWHKHDSCPRWVYGADANELRDRIADCEPVERWMDTR